eukprot:CAMPEP_0176181554 /NCGR_PEP_ID=MMETSP0120_2-20121206/93024_1 /TAXON_ID=160619 /ORGANISM="Kryptoperidinium foliaceum, Strain CCMP 1326" /LENGTH=178 /DNA_ID=CAMNT_0017519781 /DNA_START=102 /DNA_END=635 /DNA_ORIENTATION=+
MTKQPTSNKESKAFVEDYEDYFMELHSCESLNTRCRSRPVMARRREDEERRFSISSDEFSACDSYLEELVEKLLEDESYEPKLSFVGRDSDNDSMSYYRRRRKRHQRKPPSKWTMDRNRHQRKPPSKLTMDSPQLDGQDENIELLPKEITIPVRFDDEDSRFAVCLGKDAAPEDDDQL